MKLKKNKSLALFGGYNVKIGGRGGSLPEETRQKISEANKGKKRPEDWNHPVGKPVLDLTTGVFYKNTLETERKLGVSHVRDNCIGLQGTTHGRVFRYVDENNKIIKSDFPSVDTLVYNKVLDEYKEYVVENKRKNQRKGNILHEQTGRVYKSTREAAKECGVSRQSVSDILNGKKDKIKGQSFIYTEEVVTEWIMQQ